MEKFQKIHYLNVTKPCGEVEGIRYISIFITHKLKAWTYKNNTNNKDM